MLLSTLSRKAINIAVKSKRSFGGHRVLFVFRYKQQNCEVQQFENSYFELKHAPAHHHLKNQLGIRCRGTSRRTGDRHLFLPLREKQMQCHNIRRVEDRDQSSELFLEMDLQDYELHLQVSSENSGDSNDVTSLPKHLDVCPSAISLQNSSVSPTRFPCQHLCMR